MRVPSKEYDILYHFVWCVWTFDFTIWFENVRFELYLGVRYFLFYFLPRLVVWLFVLLSFFHFPTLILFFPAKKKSCFKHLISGRDITNLIRHQKNYAHSISTNNWCITENDWVNAESSEAHIFVNIHDE